MVSATEQVVQEPPTAVPSTATARPIAHVNARISAYLVDSIILFAFILVSFVIAGAQILFTSDLGEGDPPDAAYYAFVAILVGGSILAWSAFNVALMRWRGQTTGMYVIGIRTVGEDTRRLTAKRALFRWLAFHPLLFHPLLLPLWVIFSLLVVSLALPQIVLVIVLALAVLCLVSPIASLLAVLFDAERRAPHDRLARTLVVHLDQP
jgi:uncharacterized RDD family membrane protein YckC